MTKTKDLTILDEREVLNKNFRVYGTPEKPLFRARDVVKWIEHNKPYELISRVDTDEKLKAIVSLSGQRREMWFLTEDGEQIIHR